MFDPTEFAIIATFSVALFIFVVALLAKAFWNHSRERSVVAIASDESEWTPFQPPLEVELQPIVSDGLVPTWFYRRYDLLGIALIYGMFFGLVVLSLKAVEDNKSVTDANGLIGAIGFQLITAGMVSAMVIRRVGLVEWLGLKWRKGWQVFLIAPGAVFGMWLFLGGLQVSGFMKWIESLGVETVQESVKLLQQSDDPLLLTLMVAAAVIAAPICEEVVFRGYFYAACKRFVGPWVAGVCSALVFTAAHGSVVALLPLFVFGCVLALIYERTGSIWAPIAVHFCFNGATVLMQFAARFYEIPIQESL